MRPLPRSVLLLLLVGCASGGTYEGDVYRDAETHFRVEVVSAEFQGLAPVKRHRLVYGLLKDEMQTPDRPVGIHALALKTRTPEEAGVA